jgi:hypothetical protein
MQLGRKVLAKKVGDNYRLSNVVKEYEELGAPTSRQRMFGY